MNAAIPEFGPTDSEGFRSFSLYTDEGEVLRISLHIERHREQLAKTAVNLNEYSSAELGRLRTAAAIIAARDTAPIHDPGVAFDTILRLTAQDTIRDIERYFSPLATRALGIASETCVKHALNRVVQHMHAPAIYDEDYVDELLEDLRGPIKTLLKIGPGRPLQTQKYIKKTCDALRHIDERQPFLLVGGKKPTQQQLVDEVNRDDAEQRMTVRTLRRWAESCGLHWPEYLRMCLGMCGWREPKEDGN